MSTFPYPADINTVEDFYKAFTSKHYKSHGFIFSFGSQKNTSVFSDVLVWRINETSESLLCSGSYLIRIDNDVITIHLTALSDSYKLNLVNQDFFTPDFKEDGLTQYMSAKDFLSTLLNEQLEVKKKALRSHYKLK